MNFQIDLHVGRFSILRYFVEWKNVNVVVRNVSSYTLLYSTQISMGKRSARVIIYIDLIFGFITLDRYNFYQDIVDEKLINFHIYFFCHEFLKIPLARFENKLFICVHSLLYIMCTPFLCEFNCKNLLKFFSDIVLCP